MTNIHGEEATQKEIQEWILALRSHALDLRAALLRYCDEAVAGRQLTAANVSMLLGVEPQIAAVQQAGPLDLARLMKALYRRMEQMADEEEEVL